METNHIHFKIYKPYGMLSQLHSNDPKEVRNKTFLTELYDFPEGIMPVGRLDEKSEGLLLLTTDGKLSDTINRSGIEKEYWVQLDGIIHDDAILLLTKGVEIGINGKRYLTKPCSVARMALPAEIPKPDSRLRIERHRPSSWIKIILTEGKFRQIRKMTAAVGFPTQRLIRVRIGNIKQESPISHIVERINLSDYL
ncbi:pseudouridine synthase [Lutimonas zeaxanthinifaciens]|uniref:pseudouridine synthase n=1 Tax=Lutimonas zeaxanthinifaciens TaxID=3060215 RepID=UPI00265CACF6|nr:pseudouridine synthase [Lutimonas sp. YSD2104]WKK64594.1 pseudouridine synthase [Lutimonas sp. YSD2104]